MREMKDSGIAWIGEIPKEWEVTKIKHLADSNQQDSFIDGDWIESPYITDNGIRYLTTGNIGDGVYKHQGNGYISLETFNELNCKYAYPNDLVFSRLNSPYGRSCILPTIEDRYVIAVDNVILRTRQDKRYICFLTQCSGYQDKVEDGAKGTTMKRISRTNLGNVQVCLPSLSEQQSIANFLDEKCGEIDELVALQEKMIDELKAYKQSVITETVTKGLDKNVKMKDSGVEWIGEIPEHWGTSSLSSISNSMRNGYVGPTRDLFVDEGIPYIQSLHIKDGEIDFDKHRYYVRKEWADQKPKVHTGNLLVVQTGDIGQVAIVPNNCDGWNCHALIIVDLTESLCNPYYISYYLRSSIGKELLLLNKTGALLPHLNSGKIGVTMVTLPPLSEQHSIVTYLDEKCSEIDSLISIKQKKIEELKDYKKSLIYEYVTGKKQVV